MQKFILPILFIHGKGLNERTNGFVQQYFPQGMSFEVLNQALAKEVEYKWNSRSRKNLNYVTPI